MNVVAHCDKETLQLRAKGLTTDAAAECGVHLRKNKSANAQVAKVERALRARFFGQDLHIAAERMSLIALTGHPDLLISLKWTSSPS
jgi:hypothetical protein